MPRPASASNGKSSGWGGREFRQTLARRGPDGRLGRTNAKVSLSSGAGVADALESKGHRVTRIDMGRDVALRLAEAKPDVVFNALHGVPGEDGTVQGMLDLMGAGLYPLGPSPPR